MEKFRSRKFLMALASFLFVVLTDLLGIDVNQQTYWTVAGIALTYIAGEAYVDAKRNGK